MKSQLAFRVLLAAAFLFQSCASFRDTPKYQISNGEYEFRQKDTEYKKVFVETVDDSLKIHSLGSSSIVTIKPSNDEYFRLRTFDVDAMIIAFKYRPAAQNLPRQLNTDFNGNVYFGYRVDRFQVHFRETPGGLKKSHYHRAYTVGTFGGLGATAMNPWTTNNQITDEYEGVVLTRGIAFMAGLNNLTFGFGIGWDYLTDRDKDVWIYQNKPWLGVTLGLNIN